MQAKEIKSAIEIINNQIKDLETEIEIKRKEIEIIQLRCKHTERFRTYSNGMYCPDCDSYT